MDKPIQQRVQSESIKKLLEAVLGKKNFTLWAVFFLLLLTTAIGLITSGVEDIFDGIVLLAASEGTPAWKFLIKISIALPIVLCLYFKAMQAMTHVMKISVSQEKPARKKVLALFLSLTKLYNPDNNVNEIKPKILDNSLTIEHFSDSKDSWEMPLRALEYHKDAPLEVVYVFTSSGKKATSKLFEMFKETVNYLYPSVDSIRQVNEDGIDFENVEEVFNAVEDFYKEMMKSYNEKDIIVDITGGQKPSTVAGAIATLVKGRNIQYISTNEPEKVIAYDVVYKEPEQG